MVTMIIVMRCHYHNKYAFSDLQKSAVSEKRFFVVTIHLQSSQKEVLFNELIVFIVTMNLWDFHLSSPSFIAYLCIIQVSALVEKLCIQAQNTRIGGIDRNALTKRRVLRHMEYVQTSTCIQSSTDRCRLNI